MSVLSRLSREDLLALATEAGLPGADQMTAAELADAIALRLQAPPTPNVARAERTGRWVGAVDRDALCDEILPTGVGCDLPPVQGYPRCALHGGGDIDDVAVR